MSRIVPAVLPKSRKELADTLELLERIPSVERIQIDVVDGKFAAPASWPYTAEDPYREMGIGREFLPRTERFEYEIDLMCLDALKAASAWLTYGARRLTLHAESLTDVGRTVKEIREKLGGSEAFRLGVALNIGTKMTLLEPVIGKIDYVQLMGIAVIGKQGQPFEKRVIERVRNFRTQHPHLPVQVDGGVSLKSAGDLSAAGAESLIVGSAILKAKDPAIAVLELQDAALSDPFGA